MDIKYDPVYLLRAYIWQLLKHNTDMDESDYDGLTPIVPVSDEPKLQETGKPYLIYGYVIQPTERGMNFCRHGSMTLGIYATDFSKLTQILRILHTAFDREDEAARDVNEFTSTIPQFIGLRFGTISVGFGEGPQPEETEGGREYALINLQFEYYVDYDVKTNISQWV